MNTIEIFLNLKGKKMSIGTF